MKIDARILKCRSFRHEWDGHVFIEQVDGTTRWVARLECERCGTRRVDVMTARSCELVSRRYFYSDEYGDDIRKLEHSEAKEQLFSSMLKKGKK